MCRSRSLSSSVNLLVCPGTGGKARNSSRVHCPGLVLATSDFATGLFRSCDNSHRPICSSKIEPMIPVVIPRSHSRFFVTYRKSDSLQLGVDRAQIIEHSLNPNNSHVPLLPHRLIGTRIVERQSKPFSGPSACATAGCLAHSL